MSLDSRYKAFHKDDPQKAAIERQPVSSSNIKSVGYADEVLEVEFLNGSVYQYTGRGVYELYRRLMQSSSVGRFFEQEIAHNPALTPTKVK